MPRSERLAHRTWNLPSRPFDASWGNLGLRHDAISAGRVVFPSPERSESSNIFRS
jgi:hypothetical protein